MQILNGQLIEYRCTIDLLSQLQIEEKYKCTQIHVAKKGKKGQQFKIKSSQINLLKLDGVKPECLPNLPSQGLMY